MFTKAEAPGFPGASFPLPLGAPPPPPRLIEHPPEELCAEPRHQLAAGGADDLAIGVGFWLPYGRVLENLHLGGGGG